MSAVGSVLQVGRVAFEVSRFEVVGEYCRVEGQWFGVRGRRFMRPALTVVVDGRPVRLLADLAEKPWAAEDGEPWKATFPYSIEGEQSGDAELTVSPDVTITLPVPERRSVAGRRKSGSRAHAPGQPGSRPLGTRALLRELTDLRDRERQLQARLERVEADKAEITQRLLEASGELREVTQGRDESHAARDRLAAELEAVQRERSEIIAERDAALQERDAALHQRDVLAADRDAARRDHDETMAASQAAGIARDRALVEREEALVAQRAVISERDAAVAARDQAVADRDAAVSVRDEAVAERDAALSDRESLSRTGERLESALADLSSAHGAALVMSRATQAPGIGVRGHGRSIFLRRTRSGLIPGAITIVVVLAILIVWVILLRGL
jgi:hypothetical protein